MRFVSVCSGIEAASLALEPAGFQPVAFSEVEPFCCDLLRQRWPGVPNLGDLTRWREWDLPEVEMLIGGTPCQAFSVAGQRRSMGDDRANLALDFVELFHAGRFSVALWENVPGVLNTPDNAFGCFLGGLVGADGPLCEPPDGRWPCAGMACGPRARLAWRILDAQYFGLAQRRRRVFVVASAGAAGQDPSQILFESKSVQGNPQARREARADLAGTLGTSLEKRGSSLGQDAANNLLVAFDPVQITSGQNRSNPKPNAPCHTLPADSQAPCVACYGGNNASGPIDVVATTLNGHGGPNGRCDYDSETFVTHALTADGFDASEDGTGRGTPLVPVAFDPVQITSSENRSNPRPNAPCHTLSADSQAACIAFDTRQNWACASGDKASSLDTSEPVQGVLQNGVRRITVTEAERLQGMPDGWTDIVYRGKRAADGPRYKAIGNSFAVPVVRWICQRIAKGFEKC